jgi:hypothetical protein
MKKMFLLALCLLGVHSFAAGFVFQSPLTFIPSAENVYLVTVTSVVPDKVTFTVNEILRGKPVPSLILRPWMGERYVVGSYWILVSYSKGVDKDIVGLDPERRCGWIPISVMRKDGQSFVMAQTDWVEGVNLDMASDGTKGLTLEHVKRLLHQKFVK